MVISELLEVVLMPGNENSGAGIPFRMPEKELNAAIKKYKQDLAEERFPRASWPHFCATLGYTEAEVKECMERGQDRKSASSLSISQFPAGFFFPAKFKHQCGNSKINIYLKPMSKIKTGIYFIAYIAYI